MSDRLDYLVLEPLREIRATQMEHSRKLDHLGKQGEGSRQYLAYALGLGTMNEMKLRAVDPLQMDFETRYKKTEELIAELQPRMTRLEETTE